MSVAGITHDMPFSDYQALDAINASAVKHGMHSMQHMKAYVDGEMQRESPDLAFGRAVHCRVFEPERYRIDYKIATPCTATKGNSEPCGNSAKYIVDGEWRCGVRGHAPADAVEETDYISEPKAERIERIAQALHDADCMKLLRSTGWSEATLQFEIFGVPFKSRLDRLCENFTKIIDLKKCRVGYASDAEIERAISNYDYHIPAACYCYGVRKLAGVMPEFYWVFIEDGPPYAVNVKRAKDFVLECGLNDAKNTLRRWKHAQRVNEYVGHAKRGHIGEIGFPNWRESLYEGERSTDPDWEQF